MYTRYFPSHNYDISMHGQVIPYHSLLKEICIEVQRQKDILGILLIGSVARGDALPGSDLDIRFFLTDGNHRPFQREIRSGIFVEYSYADGALAKHQLSTDPMEVYAYLDGHILFDPKGIIEQLRVQAKEVFAAYQLSEYEHHKIAIQLSNAQYKLITAIKVDNLLKAAYLSSTASWTLLKGLWAVNQKPLPPSGSVWAHIKDLSKGPDNIEEQLSCLFCGETRQRIQSTLNLLAWILHHLENID